MRVSYYPFELQQKGIGLRIPIIIPQNKYLYNGNGLLSAQFFNSSEGRVRPNASDSLFVYDYFLNDHLGNTKRVITDDYTGNTPVLETSNYYPFGLMQKGIGMTASVSLHNYWNTFQKQERNEDFGVDMYEFKYRMDDPENWQVLADWA